MAARNPSAFAADPVNQAAPNSSVLSTHPVNQAAPAASAGIDGAPLALPTKKVASTSSCMTVPPPPPQAPTTEMVPPQCPSYMTAPPTEGASAMKMVPQQGAYMAEPTPPQFPSVTRPVMQGANANTVWPMPLQKPWQGGPVLAPLPFPARLPLMMVPPSPCMTALQPPQPLLPAGPPPLKRQRADYDDMPFGPQMATFDETLGLSYGPYINNEMPSVGSHEPSLPSDASNTLHIEGLPSNCTRRELHFSPFGASLDIFCPFAGYCRIRLASGRYNNRHVTGYVEFETPAQAFSAMESLQGYHFDMHDKYSLKLNLQFVPGSRSTGGHRGRR